MSAKGRLFVVVCVAIIFALCSQCYMSMFSHGTVFKAKKELYVKQKKFLLPRAKRTSYRYVSSNKRIASVSKEGKVRARKPGRVTITAINKTSGQREFYSIVVYKKIKKLKLMAIKGKHFTGETIRINTKPKTSSGKYEPLKWSSSDSHIVAVSKDGQAELLAPGTARISATTKRGKKKSVTIVVNKTPQLRFVKNNLTVEYKKTIPLPLEHGDMPEKLLTYKSNHGSVVSIENKSPLKILAKRPGKATISVTAPDGTSTAMVVRVVATKGMISRETAKAYGADNCNNLMIVAHPDDEALWGAAHMLRDSWFIVCLTNGWNPVRANEYRDVLKASGCRGVILNYPDTLDNVRDQWNDVGSSLDRDLDMLVCYKKWNQIATYNPDGVTGHIHHVLTFKHVKAACAKHNLTDNLVYFGRFYSKNALKELPHDLPRISSEEIEAKEAIIGIYRNEKNPIDRFWRQMLPYEIWVPASIWGTDEEQELYQIDTDSSAENDSDAIVKGNLQSLRKAGSTIPESEEVDDMQETSVSEQTEE